MRGDRIIIEDHHLAAARKVAKLLVPEIAAAPQRFAITIAGESGAGKSEVAVALYDLMSDAGISSVILQQDDYFVYPPKTNAEMRRKDISHVGVSEVRLALLDANLREIVEGEPRITKPVVNFDEDSVGEEVLELEGIDAAIVEGTYTTLLRHVHRRIFIDRSFVDTREARARRAREAQDAYLERILMIEHEIISQHKDRADIIITHDYDLIEHEPKSS